MATVFVLLVAFCVTVNAAPPASPRLYQHPGSAQMQQLNPLDYYLDNPEVANYYNQAQQKQVNANNVPESASRLETLEPDSEVELLPGAQQPQQPPQQTPVAPNIPGLAPGQRVFIVHMPVPGYRPGTIGGYQPVYIVAAAPQANNGYAGIPNGFQNAVLLDPSGQAVVSPVFGYPRPGAGIQAGNPNFLLGAPQTLNRPFDLVYQDPAIGYQNGAISQGDGSRGSVRLSQLVSLQGQAHDNNKPRPVGADSQPKNESQRGQSSERNEAKENEEPRRNVRPTPPHAHTKHSLKL